MNREADRMKTQELPCEIVQDILPLYHDGVVGDVTSEAVEKHLSGCMECQKEYRMLCDNLPQVQGGEAESMTKSKFDVLKKKTKKKQVIIGTVIGVGMFLLLAGLGYVLTMVPLVPVPDEWLSVDAIYRIENEDETQFFFVYEMPPYDGPLSWNVEAVETEEGVELQANIKRPVISRWSEDLHDECNIDLVSVEGIENTSVVTFAEKVVWTEEENGKDEIPEYVYLYAGYTDNPVEIDYWIVDKTGIGVKYADGREVYWNYEGNVILERMGEK